MSADLPNAFRRLHRILFAIARGMSLLLGGFTLLNVVGELRNPGFDANLWWIDLRFANRHVNCGLMLSIGIAMISFAVRPTLTQCRGWLLSSLLVFMTAIAATNALAFHRLVSAGVIQSSFVIPLSALVVAALLLILWGSRSSLRFAPRHLLDRSCFAISVAAGTILFPLAQMFCFGKTDYRRPADLIVVFGCHVRAEGVPSMALSDRVRTGVELYHTGCAPRILFSGGPGAGAIDETAAMRTLALQLGVPEHAIERDPVGLNTEATVSNLVRRSGTASQPRVLVVSNFYHLPRIKLCFRRAGWEVWTVPANESQRLYYLERYLAREVAALWWYYLNLN